MSLLSVANVGSPPFLIIRERIQKRNVVLHVQMLSICILASIIVEDAASLFVGEGVILPIIDESAL